MGDETAVVSDAGLDDLEHDPMCTLVAAAGVSRAVGQHGKLVEGPGTCRVEQNPFRVAVDVRIPVPACRQSGDTFRLGKRARESGVHTYLLRCDYEIHGDLNRVCNLDWGKLSVWLGKDWLEHEMWPSSVAARQREGRNITYCHMKHSSLAGGHSSACRACSGPQRCRRLALPKPQ